VTEAAPDLAEPIEGWRLWLAVPEDGAVQLRSVVYRTAWPAGEPMVARCLRRYLVPLPRRRRHEVPTAGCRCGIYATGLGDLRPFLVDGPWRLAVRVLGRVSLWGSVIECERGWRASHAYPSRLYVPAPDARCRIPLSAEEIAFGLTAYGVPVEILPAGAARAAEVLAA
jgi:hypothetical protein